MTSIIVIDEYKSILDATQMALSYHGWDVSTYQSGEAFLADLAEHVLHPACLIMDPDLPGICGAEVARALKRNGWHIPIIGLTARPGNKISSDLIAAGAIVMLTKPVSERQLTEHIRTALSRTKSAKTL